MDGMGDRGMIGYATFDAFGARWRLMHGSILPYSLPHRGIVLSVGQARRLVAGHGAFLIRWETAFDTHSDGAWWHLIKDTPPDLASLSPKTRNQVKRGLRLSRIERCDRELIIEKGYAVYEAAYERYETFEPMFSPGAFRAAVLRMPEDIEFWGAFDGAGALVGFGENIVDDGACFYSTMWFTPEALKNYASYAMIHRMNCHYLQERGFRFVSDGARSISHDTGIHQFLERKFGFRRAYCRLNVVYAPLVGPAVAAAYPFRRFLGRLLRSRRFDVLMRQEELRRASEASND